MLIKAAVLRGPDAAYRIEDVTLADPGPGEVLVRIQGVGLCHTDTLPRRTRSNPMRGSSPAMRGPVWWRSLARTSRACRRAITWC